MQGKVYDNSGQGTSHQRREGVVSQCVSNVECLDHEKSAECVLKGRQEFERFPESMDEENREVCLAGMQRKLEFSKHLEQDLMRVDANKRQVGQKLQRLRYEHRGKGTKKRSKIM